MLLHELLKYESIELIVGLELDQKVTRGSYKHFGTQPHFDDDRVVSSLNNSFFLFFQFILKKFYEQRNGGLEMRPSLS